MPGAGNIEGVTLRLTRRLGMRSQGGSVGADGERASRGVAAMPAMPALAAAGMAHACAAILPSARLHKWPRPRRSPVSSH
jgi:hypothetical protein